ncbi:MAG TPA: LysR family transcriptional regulator [Acetobacteraceae bacterium]|jgi:DNA-binding transcriptional LysR family regulator|nr:LysR family transcriptional regulator [Acetobacteraceae bacterium]
MSTLELRHFRYFVALAEELHFTRAARRLGISQPPLSQQIRWMEEALETPLIERGRRLVLTEAGRALLAEARAALAQAARAETVARRAGRGEIGELRLGLFASAPLLPGFAAVVLAFRKRLPGVHLDLREGPTAWQAGALQRGELDAGFLRYPGAGDLPAGLEALEAAQEPLVLVMRRDHRLARRAGAIPVPALAGEPMVAFSRAVGTTLHAQLAAMCARAGFSPAIAAEARENSTLMGLVAAGIGVAVVPQSLLRIRPEGVTRRALDGEGATTSTWLAVPRGSQSSAAQRFMDCARACIHRPGPEQAPEADGDPASAS